MKVQTNRHPITFEDPKDIEAVCLAQLGLSNKFIEASTGLSINQISHRLYKAKTAEGYQVRQTYRSEWRNGTGEAVRSVINTLVPALRRENKKTLPGLFEHPTPKIVATE